MKSRLLLLIFGFFFFDLAALDNSFPVANSISSKEWETVKELEKKNLPRSALDKVVEIHRQSIEEQNTLDHALSQVYKLRFGRVLYEDAIETLIADLEVEVKSLWPVARELAHLFLGDLYLEYYRQNQWRLFPGGEIHTRGTTISGLGASELAARSLHHYLSALRDRELLLSVPTAGFKEILHDYEPGIALYPALYHLVASKVAETLLSGALFEIPRAGNYSFSDKELLSPSNQFTTFKFPGTIPEDHQALGLLIMQDLIRQVKTAGNLDVYAAFEINRVEILYNKFTGNGADSLKEAMLQNLAQEVALVPGYSKVLYYHARFLYNLHEMRRNNSKDRDFLCDALALANHAIVSYPCSEGAKMAASLRDQILAPSLVLVAEQVAIPSKGLFYKVDYSNIDTLHVTLFGAQRPNPAAFFYPGQERMLDQLQTSMRVSNHEIPLPGRGDFRPRSVELNIQVPKPGYYLLLVSEKPFTGVIEKNAVSQVVGFQASNLALVELQGKPGTIITVVDRDNGLPVPGVSVVSYSAPPGGTSVVETEHGITCTNGRLLLIPVGTNFTNWRLLLNDGNNDTYLTDNKWWPTINDHYSPQARDQLFIFTDRAIYQPGQDIYFKVVLVNTDGRASRVVANEEVVISLRDVNGRELGSKNLVTNEFGSSSGMFMLPGNVLAGSFSLHSALGSHHFRVEEFKHPRFEVLFEPYAGLSKLNDSIMVNARSLYLTGLPLQQATYKWRVERRELHWGRRYLAQPVAIASGSGITGNNGKIEIWFKAAGIPGNLHHPLQQFRVTLEVTDPNGETRSAEHDVTLGSQAARVTVKVNNIYKTRADSISAEFTISNLSGNPVKGNINYRVSKLVAKNYISPSRYWEKPDSILHYQSGFSNPFPESGTLGYFDRGEVVKEGSIDVDGSRTCYIGVYGGFGQGHYLLETWMDVPGGYQHVTSSRFMVACSTQPSLEPGEPVSVLIPGVEFLAGQNIPVFIGSAFNIGRVIVAVTNGNRLIKEVSLNANGKWQRLTIPVDAGMVGNLMIQAVVIQDNRVYSHHETARVIDPRHQVVIELTGHGSNASPGDNLNWGLAFRDTNGQFIKGEAVALMYDASLDSYVKHFLGMNHLYQPGGHALLSWEAFGVNSGHGVAMPWIMEFRPEPTPTFAWRHYLDFNNGITSRIFQGIDMLKSGPEALTVRAATLDAIPAPQNELLQSATVKSPGSPLGIRSRLHETAFFIPHLRLNRQGKTTFSFTMPESLTRWRFMALAHNSEGVSAFTEHYLVTSRDLMIIPNLPLIAREGDRLVLKATIINNSSGLLEGSANLVVKNAVSGQILFSGQLANQGWHALPAENALVRWDFTAPEGINGLEFIFSATAGYLTDGESHVVPVLPRQTLVTETMPVTIVGKGKHHVRVPALINSNRGDFNTLTFTYTQNSAWEVLGALPWLVEQPHANSDQVFNRFFGFAVTNHLLSINPSIKRVLTAWAGNFPGDENALLSALEREPSLKSAILSATPWLNQAENDTRRRQMLARLVANGKLGAETVVNLNLLQDMQLENGSWPWFNGMLPSVEITANIVAGFGYLAKIGVILDNQATRMTESAKDWLLEQLEKEKLLYQKDTTLGVSPAVIKKLYALSFFSAGNVTAIEDFWVRELVKPGFDGPVMMQSMVALIFWRHGFAGEANAILQTLDELSLTGEGTRYFSLPRGPRWFNAPVETHVAALEAFREIAPSHPAIPGLENWLILQRRTQAWATSRATVAAVYALASSRRHLFGQRERNRVSIGSARVRPERVVSGTGYFSKTWHGNEIKPAMGNIVIQKNDESPSWAAIHLSRTEEEGQVKAGGFLTVEPKLFKQVLSNGVQQWVPVDAGTRLTTGDRLLHLIAIETPQALDFVHVNAPRPSLLEPGIQLSGFRHYGGIGYYLAITGAGNDIFIDHLPAGKHQISFETVVAREGSASAGPTRVSSFYAPEFAGHGAGGTINVHGF